MSQRWSKRHSSSADEREETFKRLYLAHREAMLAYALRRSRDADDAQDWVSETFLVLWRRIDSLPPDDEILLWLYGVIRRVGANRYRSKTRRDALRRRLSRQPEAVSDIHSVAAQRNEFRHVVDALLTMSDADREILLLAAWEGLSSAEMGAVLSCSENAATIRLHRARRRLGERVAKAITAADHHVETRIAGEDRKAANESS